MALKQFSLGDPAPWFAGHTAVNPEFKFDTVAGHYVVLSFIGSIDQPQGKAVVEYLRGPARRYFTDDPTSCFIVSLDTPDYQSPHLADMVPGIRTFWDTDTKISRLYQVLRSEGDGKPHVYYPVTFVLDPLMRVIGVIPIQDAAEHNRLLGTMLESLPPVNDHAGVPIHAPVLVLPRVFEPEFCRELIGIYNREGGYDSGFMRERNGTTVPVLDHNFKKRRDFTFEQQPEFEPLRTAIRTRLARRLVPEIQKAFQFHVTRIERFIVACYDGEEGGFFRRHRDNTTKGTAHRRFACTINLNAEDYDGGNLVFPEFGTHTYRAPTGGAVVFSCSLLHEATPVTRGTRFAFLPFFYDDEAAKIRNENKQFISGELINRNLDPTA